MPPAPRLRAADRCRRSRRARAAPRAWQRMLSGRRLDLLDPSRSTSRSRTSPTGSPASRAGTGRPPARTSSRWPSIACWSRRWRASRARLDRRGRLAVLLHDAPEYVIGDMISPFKAVIGDAYKAVESRLLAAIHLRFGLPAALPADLIAADQDRRPLRRLSRGDPARRLCRAREARRFFGPAARDSRPRSSATISRPGPPNGPRRATSSASRALAPSEL